MPHNRSMRLTGSVPRTAVVLTLVGAALCGAPFVSAQDVAHRGTPRPAGRAGGGVVLHAPVRGQSPTPNRNLTRMPAAAAVLAGEPDLQPTQGDFIRVIGPSGATVSGQLTAQESGDSTLVTTPVTGSAKGWYVVHWNLTSSDGHPMGGESGSWWAFGHRATTSVVKKPTVLRLSAAVGTKQLNAALNGALTGMRTVTLSALPGTVYAARWTLQGSVDGTTNPQFSWDITNNTRKKTAALSGIIPRPGTYVVSVLVTVASAAGKSLTEYTAMVRVRQ